MTGTPAGMDRRQMLRKSALLVGAMVWTTPLVQMLKGHRRAVSPP